MLKQPAQSDIDLWADENLNYPFFAYREMQDLAPVVHLARHDLYAITRYQDVKQVLDNWNLFSSAQGVGFNPPINEVIAGSLVGSDPPRHRHYRAILERPLSTSDLRSIRERVKALASELIAVVVRQREVEVVSQLASYLPVTLVAELVGLPVEGRERMLEWAAGAFNSLAPLGVPRVAEGMQQMAGMQSYFADPNLPERVRLGSWAARLYDAVQLKEIDTAEFQMLLSVNYVLPALDTTIHATSNLIWLLATHGDAWNQLKQNRAWVVRAVHEALRLEGPVQAFSRVVTQSTTIDGYELNPGQRLLVCFAAANRDPRHYPDPDRFDISRASTDHVAFGHAEHVCLGRNLAILELTELLTQLLEKVDSIRLIEAARGFNNGLRGFAKLQVALA
jgi:cytochrome P450